MKKCWSCASPEALPTLTPTIEKRCSTRANGASEHIARSSHELALLPAAIDLYEAVGLASRTAAPTATGGSCA